MNQKKRELDRNMMRYIQGKDWELLEALKSERMKPSITNNCIKRQIGGLAGNSYANHLVVVKPG